MKKFVCLSLSLLLMVSVLLTGCTKKEETTDNESEVSEVSSVVTPSEPSSEPEPVIVMGQIVNVDEGSYANVRSSPSMEGQIIGQALPDQQFELDPTGNEGDWVKIVFNDAPAYVHKDYIAEIAS